MGECDALLRKEYRFILMKNRILIMMKVLLLFLLVNLFAFELQAQKKQSFRFHGNLKSASLNMGLPIGIRYKYWRSYKRALAFDLNYVSDDDVLSAQANYFFYKFEAKDKWKKESFWNNAFFYIGPGALIGKGLADASSKNDFQLGIRAFTGMEYLFANSNWGYTVELAGVFFMSGKESVGVQAFIGLNYYWNKRRPTYFRKAKTRKSKNRFDRDFDDSEFDSDTNFKSKNRKTKKQRKKRKKKDDSEFENF